MPLDEHNCLYMSMLKTTKLQSFQRNISLYGKQVRNDKRYRHNFEERFTKCSFDICYVTMKTLAMMSESNFKPYSIARKMVLDEK